MTQPSNIYEEILAWGYARIDEGVTRQQFEEFITSSGYAMTERRRNKLFTEMFREIGFMPSNNARRQDEAGNPYFFTLTLEAAFKHLERVELQEAREGSRKAIFWASTSLVVTACIGLAQIWIAICS